MRRLGDLLMAAALVAYTLFLLTGVMVLAMIVLWGLWEAGVRSW